MRYWCLALGIVLAGCAKPESPPQQSSSPPPQQSSSPPQASSAAAPQASSPPPSPAPPPPDDPAPAGSNASKDQPVQATTADEFAKIERLIAPYSQQARKTYPDAKRRYLAGLPAGYTFSVTTKLRSPKAEEVAFIAVDGIHGDQITGRIASDLGSVRGYKSGDSYKLAERDIIDWVILHPDGVEEGNVVGKFLDEWSAKAQKR